MQVEINNKVFNMNKSDFNSMIKRIEASKKGSFCIFCLVLSNYARFVDEKFQTKEAIRKEVFNLARKGFKVYYTT